MVSFLAFLASGSALLHYSYIPSSFHFYGAFAGEVNTSTEEPNKCQESAEEVVKLYYAREETILEASSSHLPEHKACKAWEGYRNKQEPEKDIEEGIEERECKESSTSLALHIEEG